MIEFSDYPVEISNTQQVSELVQDILVLSWVKLSFLAAFKLLNLEENIVKKVLIWHQINIDGEYSLESLVTLSKLAHCTIMNGITSVLVLGAQDLTISVNDVLAIGFKQVENTNVEIFVALDRVRVVEDLRRELSVLDIHVFEA